MVSNKQKDELNNVFGDRIRELRYSLKLTQTEFGKNIGISAQSVSDYETYKKLPQIDTVLKIMNTYDCTFEWLCGEDKNIKKKENYSYKDMFELIFVLQDFFKRQVAVRDFEIDNPYENISRKCLVFLDFKMSNFIGSLEEIRSLYLNGTIREDSYIRIRNDLVEDMSKFKS